MRIISKFKDYYDIGLGLGGYGDSISYIREQKVIEIKKNYLHTYWFEIGFCGQVYIPLSFKKNDKWRCLYTMDEVDNYVERYFSKKRKKEYYEIPKYRTMPYLARDILENRVHCEQFFKKASVRYQRMFREHNTPIYVVNFWEGKIIINERLNSYEFFKVKPPYIAYQELEMYVGGILNQKREVVPEVSNDDLIIAKGFDLKRSFRREKA